MSNLIAVVKATRASANALKEIQRLRRLSADLDRTGFYLNRANDRQEAQAAIHRAEKRYDRAQAVLAANPLPGDR